ncbi:MAG: homocysteine S-methyltransferase family protein [Pirellulales bacterium]|nr:homocysteine S-methyltransferase family protein [Pirellulales bacterium]
MATLFRDRLPQLDGRLFLTDGGQETTFVFHDGLALPEFAAFDLLRRDGGEAHLAAYYRSYAAIAAHDRVGLILEAPTWRASSDWGQRLGYAPQALDAANRRAIALLAHLRDELRGSLGLDAVVISGCVGPRGDGYKPGQLMSAVEAERYHRRQIESFSQGDADIISAMTMNYVEEALGIARAARRAGMPVAISFTVETDGRLPTGQTLRAAIEHVDNETGGYPIYYMINCAHPVHIERALDGGLWQNRLRGLRANASAKSHAELDQATELDSGNPAEFGRQYAHLKQRLPQLNVLGGCCGTDTRHVASVAAECAGLFAG